MNKTRLIKHAHVLVTMNDLRREILDGAVFVRDNIIEQVGPTSKLPQTADEVIDATDHVVLPGLINTHHHMYRSLTRVIPAAQDGELFNWLTNLYPIWANLTPEMMRISTLTAMTELLLSGCTTTSDHLYIYPNGCKLDQSIDAAQQIGMRFHAARGSMSVGQSKGGLPPDRVVEDEAAILKDTQRLIETYHDASRHTMQRIVVAPCSPFSVSRDLMREAARASHTVRVPTCGLHPVLLLCAKCAMPACQSDLASMALHQTIPAICLERCDRRCYYSVSDMDRMR